MCVGRSEQPAIKHKTTLPTRRKVPRTRTLKCQSASDLPCPSPRHPSSFMPPNLNATSPPLHAARAPDPTPCTTAVQQPAPQPIQQPAPHLHRREHVDDGVVAVGDAQRAARPDVPLPPHHCALVHPAHRAVVDLGSGSVISRQYQQTGHPIGSVGDSKQMLAAAQQMLAAAQRRKSTGMP